MTIALYGHSLGPEHRESIQLLLQELSREGVSLHIYEPFMHSLHAAFGPLGVALRPFLTPEHLDPPCDLMLSIGGDGTFLESASMVRDSGIPIAGINFGRLGFLTHFSAHQLASTVHQLLAGEYAVEQRAVLRVVGAQAPIDYPFALNDVTLQKPGGAMITVQAHIDREYLCTYWADGLIVATPTGSTAYSLSVGGPIVCPLAQTLALLAIAPHHLTVRPLVIPDTSRLRFIASSRSGSLLLSIDSKTYTMPSPLEVEVVRADFTIGVVSCPRTSYYRTIRDKLMWGADQRNSP